MSMSPATPSVQLPPGVTVIGYRETSQANPMGQIVQGLVFTLRLPSGGQTSVFIANSLLGSTEAIASAFTERVDQIQAIENLGNPGA